MTENSLKTDYVEIKVSLCLEENEDSTWTGWPEYADYIRVTEDTKVEVVRELLSRTADLYEDEEAGAVGGR